MGFPGISKEMTSKKHACEKSPFRCQPSEGSEKQNPSRCLVGEGNNLFLSCSLTTEYTGSLGKWVACEITKPKGEKL